MAEVRGVDLGSEGGRPAKNGNHATVAQLAKEVGVPELTAGRRADVF